MEAGLGACPLVARVIPVLPWPVYPPGDHSVPPTGTTALTRPRGEEGWGLRTSRPLRKPSHKSETPLEGERGHLPGGARAPASEGNWEVCSPAGGLARRASGCPTLRSCQDWPGAGSSSIPFSDRRSW